MYSVHDVIEFGTDGIPGMAQKLAHTHSDRNLHSVYDAMNHDAVVLLSISSLGDVVML